MIKKLLTFICALTLFGCAGKGEKTTAELKLFSGHLAVSSYTGGVMLWGSSTDGQNAFGTQITNNTFEIELSNGTWNFIAIGWDGASQMSGTPSCAVAKGIELGGSAIAIDLSLANSKCADNLISTGATPGSFDYTFPRLATKICNSDAPLDGTGCADSLNGYASSIRVFLPSFARVDGVTLSLDVNAGLGDSCHTIYDLSSGGIVLNNLSVPTGGVGSPLFTMVRAYMGDTDCEGVADTALSSPIDLPFPSGLSAGQGAPKYFSAFTNQVSPYSHEQASLEIAMDKASLCNAERIAALPFAAGEGDVGRPYVICSIDQLDGIGGTSNWTTNNSKHFILGKDVDYFSENGVDLQQVLDTQSEPNYPDSVALGEDYSTTPSSPTPFTGTFDGRGHKIIGHKQEDIEDLNMPLSRIGFIRDMGTSGKLKNVTFLMPMVEARAEDQTNQHNQVGIAVGANAGTIENVKIIHGEVMGREQVGGVVGRNDGIILNVAATQMRIEGFSTIGGIAGAFNNPSTLKNITKAIFDGNIRTRSQGFCSDSSAHDVTTCEGIPATWYGHDYIGGIVGLVESCENAHSEFQEVASHGSISGLRYIGGLIGKAAGSECQVTDAYSDASIHAEIASNSAGLVGYQDGATFVADKVFRASGPISSKEGTIFQNFSSTVTGSNVVSIDPAIVATGLTHTDVRTQSTYTALGMDFVNIWAMDDNGFDYPRLQIEGPRKCAGKMAVAPFAAGSGAAADPYQICSQAQLGQVKNYPGAHFKLMRDIGLENFTTGTTSVLDISSFGGVFDGNAKTIYPVNLTSSQTGLFNSLAIGSQVKNLEIISSQSMPSSGSSGLLTGINNGLISRVRSKGQINLSGSSPASCLVGINNGVIAGSKVDCSINVSTALSSALGGIANVSSGAILYNEFKGRIALYSTQSMIGSLVGETSTGSANSFYDPASNSNISFGGATGALIAENRVDGSIILEAGSQASEKIGGLVGSMSGSIATIKNNQLHGQIIYKTTAASDLYDYIGPSPSAPGAGTAGRIYMNTTSVIGDIYLDNGASWDLLHNIGSNPYPSSQIGLTPKTIFVGGVAGQCGDSGSTIEENFVNTRFEFRGTNYPSLLNNTWAAICGDVNATTMNANFYVWNPMPVNFNSTNTAGEYGAYKQSTNALNTLIYVGDFDSTNSTASDLYVTSSTVDFDTIVNTDVLQTITGQYTVTDDSTVASDYVSVAEAIGSIENGSAVYLLDQILDQTSSLVIFQTTLLWDVGTDWNDPSSPWVIEDGETRPYLVRQERSSDDFSVEQYVQTYFDNR